MLDVDDLTVDFPQFSLGPVSLNLRPGDFASLIGPNGAGKSTVIRGLLGLVKLSSGRVTLDGQDLTARVPAVLARAAYLTDSADDLLEEFSPVEYWDYVRLVRQAVTGDETGLVDRARALAERLGLTTFDQRLYTMSLGMRRKAQLAAVLAADADLLVMDEPFIGLDFISSRVLQEILVERASGSTAILCSSHDLTIAARVSTKALVLYAGRTVLNDSIASLGGSARLERAIIDALGRAGVLGDR